MDSQKIALYSALKKYYFDLKCNINCDSRDYAVFTNVDKYFNIKGVEREELIEIGLGVKISRPVEVEKGLKGGGNMLSSLSHNGVLAIYCYSSEKNYQLTNLINEKQIEIRVEEATHTGFYNDSMVMLTLGKPLRVCPVEDIFLEKKLSVLKSIGDMEICPWTDVTLLHSTRNLLFVSKLNIPHEFNVDTEVVRKLEIGKELYAFTSLTGIEAGMKGLFVESETNENFIYSLNEDDSTSLVLKNDPGWGIQIFIPSSTDPRNQKKGLKIHPYGTIFTDATEEVALTTPFKYQDYQSIVRLYQDIFLAYDEDREKWHLVKIIVP